MSPVVGGQDEIDGCIYYVGYCVTVESEADQAASKCLGCEGVLVWDLFWRLDGENMPRTPRVVFWVSQRGSGSRGRETDAVW